MASPGDGPVVASNGYVRPWAVWLAVAGAAAVAYPLMPAGPVAKIYFNVLGVGSVLAVFAGIARHRPGNRGAWLLFGAGTAMFISGDVCYDLMEQTLGEYPYPSWADGLYLAAYPLLCLGLSRLGKGRADRVHDVGGMIDAAVISTGIGLVYWVFVIGPTLSDAGTPIAERLVTIGYPAADVLLTAVGARMITRTENRSPSLRLLGLGTILLLCCDVFYSLLSSAQAYTGGIFDAGFLLSYVCWGAAALHPSMRWRPDPAGSAEYRIGARRLTLLAACSMLAPGVLFVQGLSRTAISWVAVGVGAVALFLLVVARMWGFVTQVQHQAHRLEGLAMRDELTGTANRRRFEQRLHEQLAAGPVAVFLLDLDGFKTINDRFGHAVGDELLAAVATRIAAEVPPEGLVARMGGDEFAVLLPAAPSGSAPSGDDLDALADRLRSAIRRPVRAGGHDLLISTSIGITAGSSADPMELLRQADVAMYAAKVDGGRQRHYDPELDDRAGEEARLGADLRSGLARGEFHLVYQPIVELPHGAVVAVESLIRWQHPTRGFVGPDQFIPVAERNGLIVELGEWILRTACEQFVSWQREGVAPPHFGVNVSARQLAEPGFAGLVADVLASTGVHPHNLVVEVTETAVFGGGAAAASVRELVDLGVDIALDDFGTGHSSLGLLQTLPVRILKVDKSFVENVTMAGRHAVIATALIQVADGLGLVAVAEGVETAEQAAELYRLGYRKAQGYHFGRPAVVPDFAQKTSLTRANTPT
ncbi:bifunctional diguanylate cyclase/phosphodiesterase [Actinoplanes sp. NBRC 101535]|uniref:putative bifunctional diguanylate cyclase/phosphodiesterase n=1 Tax=Actinoplanes sp. NBRC 101535 TaxID=3032196 RepID=UPI0033382B20